MSLVLHLGPYIFIQSLFAVCYSQGVLALGPSLFI